MKNTRNLIKSEKGSIIVLAVFMMILGTAVFSYVVDLGRIQLARHKLYVSADMASLAAATQIDRDEARGVNPRAIIKRNDARNTAISYINKNQFDKGGQGWLGIGGKQIKLADFHVENAQGPNELVAMVTVTTKYTISPLVFEQIFSGVEAFAESKAVVYLTY